MTLDLHLFLRYFTELMMVLPAAAIAIIPVSGFRKVTVSFLVTMLSCVIIIFLPGGALLCTLLGIKSNTVIFPFMTVFYALYHYCYQLSSEKKLFCFLNAAMLCAFSGMYSVIVTAPLELGNRQSVLMLSSGLISIGITMAILGVFFRTLAVKLPELLGNSSIDKIWKGLILVPLFMTAMCVWMKPISPENMLVGRVRAVCIVFLPLIPIVVWVLFHIQWWMAKRMEENSELQRSYDILKLEEKRYANTMEALEEARNLRHDFRQHMLVIDGLAHKGDTERLTEYIKPFIKASNETHRQHFKNYVLDAVASHYVELAEKQRTRLVWSIALPEELPFKLSDICALFGNLLENSLNATSTLPEEKREVRIAMGLKSDAVLVISVSNPFTGVIRRDKDGLPTSMEKNHGIGLRSVYNTVKRYNGSISVDTDDGIFEVSIILNSEEV